MTSGKLQLIYWNAKYFYDSLYSITGAGAIVTIKSQSSCINELTISAKILTHFYCIHYNCIPSSCLWKTLHTKGLYGNTIAN